MILEKVKAEKIMDVIVRRIFRLRDLLKDNGPFAFDLVAIENRMKKNVCQ